MTKYQFPRQEFSLPHDTCGVVYCNLQSIYKIRCSICDEFVSLHNFRRHHLQHLCDQLKEKQETTKTELKNNNDNEEFPLIAIQPDRQEDNETPLSEDLLMLDEDDNNYDPIAERVHSHVELVPMKQEIETTHQTPADINHIVHASECLSSSSSEDDFEWDNDSMEDDYPELPKKQKKMQPIISSTKDKRLKRINFQLSAFVNDPNFICAICSTKFDNKIGLTSHLRWHKLQPDCMTKDSPKFKCNECDEEFMSERNLNAHAYKHTGYFCNICKKTFASLGSLKTHKTTHGEKKFKCNDCDAMFFNIYQLRIHNAKHTGIRQVICELCAKPCKDRGVLAQHMLRHTGERPFQCPECEKRFYSNHDLKEHIVIHSNERPFACDICGSAFQRKKALRVHIKTHSNEPKTVECKVCYKKFVNSSGLLSHMRVHDTVYGLSYPVSGTVLSNQSPK